MRFCRQRNTKKGKNLVTFSNLLVCFCFLFPTGAKAICAVFLSGKARRKYPCALSILELLNSQLSGGEPPGKNIAVGVVNI